MGGRHHHVVIGNDSIRWVLRERTLIEAIGHRGTEAEVVLSPVVGGNLRVRFTHSKFCSYGNSDSIV
jgi:hypothetical protein